MSGPITLKLVLDEHDFDRLLPEAQEWASQMDGDSGLRYQISDGRFKVAGTGERPATKWAWGYWTENYAGLILARAFLGAWGIDYQTVWDDGAGGWGILTDYVSPGIKEMEARR